MDGWCEGTLNGKKGMFPDNFVKEVKKEKPALPSLPASKKPPPPSSSEPVKTGVVSAELRNRIGSIMSNPSPPVSAAVGGNTKNKKAKVTHDYQPQNPDELALEVGQIIEILKQEEEGWWEGNIGGKIGMFPSNFVEVVESPEQPSSTSADEVTAIKGKRVQGVGFGNIFGGGPINLRPTQAVPGAKKEVSTPDGDHDKAIREVPRASNNARYQHNYNGAVFDSQVKARLQNPVPPSAAAPAAAAHQEAKVASVAKVVAQETKQIVRAIVRYPYSADNDDELNLAEGDIITILDQNLPDAGWWKGELKGHVGVFPDNFVELLPVETKPLRPPVPAAPVNNGLVQQHSNEFEQVKLKSAGPREPPARPPSMLIAADKTPLGVRMSAAGKVPDTRPSVAETDDHKAKSQHSELYRSGTLDRAVTSETPLKPLTVDRPKMVANRRPPNMAARREPVIPEAEVKVEAKADAKVEVKKEDKLLPDIKVEVKKEEKQLPAIGLGRVHKDKDKEDAAVVVKKEVVTSSVSSIAQKHEALSVSKTNSNAIETAASGSTGDVAHLQQEINRLREDLEQMKRQHDKRLNSLVAELDEEKKTRLNLQVEIERLKKRLAE